MLLYFTKQHQKLCITKRVIVDKEKEKKTVNEVKPLRSINITFQGQGKISTSKGTPPLLKLPDRAHKYF